MLMKVLRLRTMTTMVKAAKVVIADAPRAKAKVSDALARATISVQIAFQVSGFPKEKAKAKVRDAQEKAKANVAPLAMEKANAITLVPDLSLRLRLL